ncbi:MAG: hypothetical protein KTR21_16695 [Rhodobacteraceae bacterium]|nr:hypothetical protein [Paracoccaceae bacterium]
MTLSLAVGGGVLALYLWMVWPAFDSRRWSLAIDISAASFIWGGLGVALLVMLFYRTPELIPLIIVAIMVHEYGHVLAYRLAGHSAPKFRLVPFGGVAISNEPYKTQAEQAYIALMGPGFSIALLVAASVASGALAMSGDLYGARYAYHAAQLIGLLNAFNLLPFYPLDGGRVLRAIAMTIGPGTATAFAVIMSGVFGAFAFLAQMPVLLLFAGLGLIAALRPSRSEMLATPMNAWVALLAFLAYAATFAAHAWVSLPWLAGILSRAAG